MSEQVCLNKSCNSFGSAHPNCRCHGGMAHGGKVERFCGKTQDHKPECNFAKGGFAISDENDSHYTLKHPKGDILKIAKKGISSELHAHIKKLAKGGEVKNPISEGFTNATGATGISQGLQNIKHFDEGGEVQASDGDAQKPVTININTSQDRQPAAEREVDPKLLQQVRTQQTQPQPGAMTMSDVGHGISNFLTAPLGGSQVPAGGVPYSSKFANADEWQAYNKAASQGQQPLQQAAHSSPANFQNVALTNVIPDQEQIPQAPAPMPQASAKNDYANQIRGDIGMFQKGIQQKTQADTAVADQMAPLYQRQVDDRQQFLDDYQNQKTDIENRMKQTADELNGGKIDFNKVWHNKGTGTKIMAGIGMLLSGVGSGLSGQPNMAMKVINDEIERDIDAQKQEHNNKRTALSAYSTLLGDMGRGAEHLRLGYDSLVAAQLNKVMTSQAGPLAQSRANLAMSEFMPAMQERLHNAALSQAMMDQMGRMNSGNPQEIPKTLAMMDVMNKPMADEYRKRYIPEVGKFGSRPVDEKDQKEISKRIEIDNKWNDLINWTRDNNGSVDPRMVAQGRAKAALLLNEFRQGEGMGVPREATQEFEKSLIDPHPDKFFAATRGVLSKYEEVRKANHADLTSKLKSYGISGQLPTAVAGSRLRPHSEVSNVANRTR